MSFGWKKFISCECHTEGVMIGYFDEGRFSEEIYLGFFRNYWECGFHWKQKLRYIWNVLTKNEPFLDQVVLNRQTLNDLRAALDECAKRLEQQKEVSDAT
jgi:hypothetical protein